MERAYDLKGIDARIRELGQGIEAVRRNVDRILASVKMIELNVCDVVEVL